MWTRFGILTLAALFLTSSLFASQPRDVDLSVAAPEKVGFSTERLRRLDSVMQQAVDDKQWGGIVVLLARHGKVVRFESFGTPSILAEPASAKDSIFRLVSMSKPLTATAMMLLNEEGKWSPKDPIAKFVPEFKSLKVFKDVDDYGNIRVEEPEHAPNMRELMTHTAGFSSGLTSSPVDRFYQNAEQSVYEPDSSLQVLIERVAKAPLLYQPSRRWVYSLSVDVQGYIVEKLSGMSLPEFMKRRIFEPLGMKDTDFYVPREKWKRFATVYDVSVDSQNVVRSRPMSDAELTKETLGADYHQEPSQPSGGIGIVSTVKDYFRFAQMLLNGGELNGVRILAPSSVKLMMSDHLPDNMTSAYRMIVNNMPRLGIGFGYGAAVVVDPGKADVPLGKGSYTWDGGLGTWFWVDPVNDIIFVGMANRLQLSGEQTTTPTNTDLYEVSRIVTYQALLNSEL